jgi:aspartyl-tRNA(Asn)/glutamyl-tRNA(Gln) amidotransferase subunit B
MDNSIYEKYELISGLEVHAQMLTQSKAYSGDSTEYGQLPNTNVSVITLAHPGTLPRFNEKVLEYALKMGLSVNAKITEYNIFARKNYFYPDLPKGYQITQDKTPICTGGFVPIKLKDGTEKNIRLVRIHMEEDAGKSMHIAGEEHTLVDFNRAGVPLIEIVSEPDIRSGEEAYLYLTEIRRIVRYLEICDGNMEEGSLRCDVNVSVRLRGTEKFGTKVEVKNLNSFRNVQRALEYEFLRQTEMLERGETILSETRTFDAVTGKTSAMRMKETLNDYRYFPEPDLQPVVVTKEYLAEVKKNLPALPNELRQKYINEYGLPEYDANVLVDSKEIALFFEEVCKLTKNYKAASNWVMGPVKSYLNELTLHMKDFPLSPQHIADLVNLVEQNKISFSNASQRVFAKLTENPNLSAEEAATALDLIQNSDSDAILNTIREVVAEFPDKVSEYRNGKKGLLAMFMGQVMKRTKGKADPKVASALLEQELA